MRRSANSCIFTMAQSFIDAARRFPFSECWLDAQAVGDVFSNIEMREERVMLEDSVHAALVGRKRVEALAVHPDFAGSGLFESGDQAKQSGFAGAAFTEQGEKFARGDLQRKSFRTSRAPKRLATPRTSSSVRPARVASLREVRGRRANSLGGFDLVPDFVVLRAARNILPEINALSCRRRDRRGAGFFFFAESETGRAGIRRGVVSDVGD